MSLCSLGRSLFPSFPLSVVPSFHCSLIPLLSCPFVPSVFPFFPRSLYPFLPRSIVPSFRCYVPFSQSLPSSIGPVIQLFRSSRILSLSRTVISFFPLFPLMNHHHLHLSGLKKKLVSLTVDREKGAKKLQVQTKPKHCRKFFSHICGQFSQILIKNICSKHKL